MKDKLVTKNYIEILAANFLLYFGFYLLMPVLPFYLILRYLRKQKGTIVLSSRYTIAALCPSVFGLSAGYFCQKTALFISLFSFYGCLRRISVGGHPHFIHTYPHLPRLSLRNGHGSRKHGSHRHHAQFTAWRGTGILWNDEQHGNEHRPDGRTIST